MQMQNEIPEYSDEYDREFIFLIMEIEKRYDSISKHDRLKIESWCKKLNQVTNNKEWKKNRNLHAISILDMILNLKLESPYNKFAPEGAVPIISKSIVKSRLSNKFYEMNNQLNENVNVKAQEKFNYNYYGNTNDKNACNRIRPQTQSKENNEAVSGSSLENNLEELKDVIMRLNTEIKMKDDIIKRQNDEKLKLQVRISELEKILNSLVNLEKNK